MIYRGFKGLDIPVSAVGFGCWAMGGAAWGSVNDADAVAAVRRSLDFGITLFDTAPGYGAGHSEELLAKGLEGKRESVAISTKFGLPVLEDGSVGFSCRPESIVREAEDSLRRLRTDYIDVYLMHWPDPGTPICDVVGALAKLKEQGKIRAAGMCNVDPGLLEEALRCGSIDAIQVPYSLFMRGVEGGLLQRAAADGVEVMGYGSLAFGLLGGKMNKETKFNGDDWRSGQLFGTPNWAEEEALFDRSHFESNLAKVDALKVIANREGIKLQQLAVGWSLQKPGITTALVGAKRAAQVDDWAQASDIRWRDGMLSEIEEIMS